MPPSSRLRELAGLFVKLGVVAFGGPAAHIAMFEDEVVTRRQWLSADHFLDLVGATSLIPGPNSTEMTMHIGYERAGWRGMAVAGTLFILPAALLTGLLAWLYVAYGTLPQAEPLLAGVKPAVIVLIASAVWKLGRKAVKSRMLAILGFLVIAAVLLGMNEVVALLGGGILGMVALRWRDLRGMETAVIIPFLTPIQLTQTAVAESPTLWQIGLFFLKIGSILYGSGYVLIAFLEGELVEQYGWLTQSQLLDAIAIGQLTPGPILTTATFIGYLLAGWQGAIVATVGIFLPSFLFVLILNPLIPKMRQSAWLATFLDAINVTAVALMVAVVIRLSVTTLVAWPAWVIVVVAAVVLFKLRWSSIRLIVIAAGLGFLLY